jgi:uncharacterized paraquat-inducible protein A
MKLLKLPTMLPNGIIEPAHEIEIVCAQCGYDLDESELEADTCSDCNTPLDLKRSMSIQVTTIPAASGSAM